jgi:prephenate dehydrogenase
MAVVQGLTFFIARTLDDMKLREQQLSTPSFERLLHLAELEQHHSAELFRTIQQGNSYTQNVRRAFMDAAHIIDKELDEETK